MRACALCRDVVGSTSASEPSGRAQSNARRRAAQSRTGGRAATAFPFAIGALPSLAIARVTCQRRARRATRSPTAGSTAAGSPRPLARKSSILHALLLARPPRSSAGWVDAVGLMTRSGASHLVDRGDDVLTKAGEDVGVSRGEDEMAEAKPLCVVCELVSHTFGGTHEHVGTVRERLLIDPACLQRSASTESISCSEQKRTAFTRIESSIASGSRSRRRHWLAGAARNRRGRRRSWSNGALGP